jgi:predicted enzyme related to lactoylglutathione lyase
MTRMLANVDVDDLERGIAFYREGLGLRLGRRLFDGAVAEMLGGSMPIHLIAKKPGTPAVGRGPSRRDYGRHWTPIHFDFVVGDVERAVRNACAAGAVLEEEARTYAWGRIATLSDPFGHGFCVLELVGDGYDAVADGGGRDRKPAPASKP